MFYPNPWDLLMNIEEPKVLHGTYSHLSIVWMSNKAYHCHHLCFTLCLCVECVNIFFSLFINLVWKWEFHQVVLQMRYNEGLWEPRRGHREEESSSCTQRMCSACREETPLEARFGGVDHFLVKEPVNLEPVRYLDTDNAIWKGNVCTNQELTYAKRVIQAIHLLWFILFMISFKNHVICNVKPSHEEKGQTRGEGHA